MNNNFAMTGVPQNANQFYQQPQNILPALPNNVLQAPIYDGSATLLQNQHVQPPNNLASNIPVNSGQTLLNHTGSEFDLESGVFNVDARHAMAGTTANAGTTTSGMQTNISQSRTTPQLMTGLMIAQQQISDLIKQRDVIQISIQTQSKQHQNEVTKLQQ